MKRLHYGWFVCLGCALVLFCTSGLAVNAFTIFQPFLLQQNGFTNTQSSAIITVRSLMGFLSMLLTKPYYNRLSLRTGLSLSCGIIALGFVLFAAARSFSVCCAAAAVVGLGYGLGTMIPVAMLTERWFTQKRTLAVGLCSSVTGLSTLGIPTLLIRLIGRFGLTVTFLLEAAGIALFAVAAFLLLRSDPSPLGLTPYGGQGQGEISQQRQQTAELRGKDWLLLVPMLLLLGGMTNTGYSHLSVHMTANGFSAETAALAVSVSGITLVAAKCLFGKLGDRFSVNRCSLLFGTAGIIGLALLCLMGDNAVLLYAGVFLYSTGLAMTTVGLTAWAGDWSSRGQYDATIRRFQIGSAAGGLVFSPLPGILADNAGGLYVPAYLVFTACAVFVLLTARHFYRKSRKGFPRGRTRRFGGRINLPSHSHSLFNDPV